MSSSYTTKCSKNRFSKFSPLGFLFLVTLAFVLFLTPQNAHAVDVSLAWDACSEPDLSGYRVFFREEGKDYNYNYVIWEGTDTTCTIYNLDDSTTYYFVTRAFNEAGNESGDSNEVHYQPQEDPPENYPPRASNQSVTTYEGTPVSITLAASDNDQDPLTYTVVDYPSYGTLSGTPPNLTYTPEAGFNGGDSFTFMVNDGQLDSTIATVSIAIINSDSTYFDDFETYAAGTDPVDWLYTGPQNSMVEDDTLFRVFDLNGENVFGTTSTQANIHSHYMGTGVDAFSSYEYTGSMMITSANGGIGVTFLSQYPSEDAYYRLRRHGSNSFHISPHGTTISGTTDTGVVPVPNIWYRFVIIVEDTETRTEIRAKVWPDGTTEPADWQVNAYDNSPTRLTSGTIGVWSYSSGSKYWDDLAVNELTPDTYYSLSVTTAGSGMVTVHPDQETYVHGDVVTLTAVPDAGYSFFEWSGDLAVLGNPATLVITRDHSVTATFVPDTPPPVISDVWVMVGHTTATITWTTDKPATSRVDYGLTDAYELGSIEAATPKTEHSITLSELTPEMEYHYRVMSADVSGPSSSSEDLTFTVHALAYFDDFETYAAGTDPVDWLDTGPQNSMVEDDTLFRVFDLNGENVFGTTSTQTNIHSHYMGTGVDAFSSYEYTGSMMITSANGGIGVTFLSQYPSEDAYYRLRRHGSNSFHISPHGTTISGTTDTGVVPVPNVWYRFVIIVEDTETRTEIRAKVWPDGTTEPADWQVNAYDNSPTRLTSGTIGVWSYSSGSKYWDDLAVNELTPDTYYSLSVTTVDSGMITENNKAPIGHSGPDQTVVPNVSKANKVKAKMKVMLMPHYKDDRIRSLCQGRPPFLSPYGQWPGMH